MMHEIGITTHPSMVLIAYWKRYSCFAFYEEVRTSHVQSVDVFLTASIRANVFDRMEIRTRKIESVSQVRYEAKRKAYW